MHLFHIYFASDMEIIIKCTHLHYKDSYKQIIIIPNLKLLLLLLLLVLYDIEQRAGSHNTDHHRQFSQHLSHFFNPSNAEATFVLSTKIFDKPSKPCHVGIHWIALTEYSQMSTHLPEFRPFFSFYIILYWPNQPPAA